MNNIKIFAGTANVPLADAISKSAGISITKTEISRFSDGEIRVELDDNVRGCDAYIIQPTCAPTNDNLMELILLADALKRSSANKITAIIPYYGYSRQDRRPGYSRVPISARVVADLIQSVGISHVVLVDIHATQIQGFFQIPVDNISANQLFVADIYKQWMNDKPIIVSPDVGGVARARNLAKMLDNMDLAIIDKRRPKANVSEVMNIIGDVKDRTCIMVDDMVDTAGTLVKGVQALYEIGGAKRVVAYATHGVLSGNAINNITNSKLDELIVTDSIPFNSNTCSKVRQLSISDILAETIMRLHTGNSIRAFLE